MRVAPERPQRIIQVEREQLRQRKSIVESRWGNRGISKGLSWLLLFSNHTFDYRWQLVHSESCQSGGWRGRRGMTARGVSGTRATSEEQEDKQDVEEEIHGGNV